MKLPRFRIAWVMVAIAMAALDLVAIRSFLDSRSPVGDELLLGALPMANVLAVGLLVGQQRPESRPFLLGFEIFGAMALASYIALALFSVPGPSGPIRSYVGLILDPILAPMRMRPPRSPIMVVEICMVVLFMLGWPQVAIALLGGFLSRRYKVTISRR